MAGIVFDFDGVLVDSEPAHEAALRGAVRELGMDFTPEQYQTRYLGFDDRDAFAAIARDHSRSLSPAEQSRLADLKWARLEQTIAGGKVRAFPGAIELLRAAAASGPVAVCSGARRHEIEAILGKLGALCLVPVLVSADDVAKSKPDPASYALVVSRLGVDARACVAIEDTAKGIRSARGAGLSVAGVCHSTPSPVLTQAGATLVRNTIKELSVPLLLGLVQRP